MAHCPRSNVLWVAGLSAAIAGSLALCAAAIAANAAPSFGQNKCNEPIELNSDTLHIDAKTNVTQLRNVVISQCGIRVEAKNANAVGLNTDNTHWTFEGDVKIDVEKRGSLRSKQAVVDVLNSQISKATITGTPAEFEQRGAETNLMARGHAGEIVFEVGPGTVRLQGDAWLQYGGTEMKNSTIVYNIRDEQVQGAVQPGDQGRVHIRIMPKQTPQAAPKGDSGAQSDGSAVPPPSTPAKPKAP